MYIQKWKLRNLNETLAMHIMHKVVGCLILYLFYKLLTHINM